MNHIRPFLMTLCLGWVLQATATEIIAITPQQQTALGIRLGQAEPVASFSSLKLPGEVILPVGKEYIVSAPQAGLIDRMYAAAGQQVRRGQPMAHLSSQELALLQRDYLQSQTRQRLARKNLDRDAELFKDGIIAERRFLATQAEFEEADAALQQGRQSLLIAGLGEHAINQIKSARHLGSGTTLTAPISGQVIEQNVNAGQRVDPATPLFKIADLSTLWLLVHVPVDALHAVRQGSSVSIGDTGIEGKVTAIVRNANRSEQTVQVRAKFRDPAQRLVPGQFVEARLSLDEASADTGGKIRTYRLPRNAVTRHAGKAYVFVKAGQQNFELQQVEVVAETCSQATIKSAVPLDRPVAMSGIATLKAAWLGHSGEEE